MNLILRQCNCHILPIILVTLILTTGGCHNISETEKRLDLAEVIMESQPDSALNILEGIHVSDLKNRRQIARYSLLKSIALDKNYIDAINFDVLQPAIEYYLDHGTPDEKLKTYYYQGRIYQNAGEDDLAMQAFLNVKDITSQTTDTLTLARLLAAQGVLYLKQYRISDFIDNNLKAADLYKSLGNTRMQLRRCCIALDGEIILKNKSNADSIYNICLDLINDNPTQDKFELNYFLRYALEYGTTNDIWSILREMEYAPTGGRPTLNLAQAYAKTGATDEALECLENVKISPDNIRDSLSYWVIKADIMENMGDYKAAADNLRNYTSLLAASDYNLFSNELLFSEKKHEMEMNALVRIQKKDRVTMIIIGVLIFLLFMLGIMYYAYRLNKARRIIAEHYAVKSKLNEDILKKEKENAELKIENLRFELGKLEEEHQRLSSLLEERKELEGPMRNIIKKRLDILNSLLAKEITSNETYAKPYRKWIESIRNDQKTFMNSTRMAFQASHPEFIAYLNSHALSEDEINYVCLYALGLRGKEVGEYIQLKRHYSVSSEIRRKLGIGEHETNLGPYIRKLMNDLC